jgi:dephospho-CoA kinase
MTAPFLLGLTGSIGMGKSKTSELFRELGVPVYDADATVHTLYAKGGAAVDLLQPIFPTAITDGAVDRAVLSSLVLKDADALKQLEQIVHPLAGQQQLKFIQDNIAAQTAVAIFDIPLLFENGGETKFDAVIVVSAPAEIQKQRVLERPNMTEDKFNDILAKQVPDAIKREKADFIVDSSISVDDARRQVGDILIQLKQIEPKALRLRMEN